MFFASAYFCPGGGWNQNARFDQVRAVVEGGTFAIDDFLVYAREGGTEAGLVRQTLPPGTPVDRVPSMGNTGDVTAHEGRIYPGKPPGAVLAAAPVYWIIYQVERQLGIDPDDWWPLTVNAWLTRVLSVGLITAAGAVIFLRLSRRLFPGVELRSHVLATLAVWLGTLLWPFGTLFFDHNIIAVLLLAAFALLVRARDESHPPDDLPAELTGTEPASPRRAALRMFAAGLILGCATITNYVSILPTVLFSVYVLALVRPLPSVLWLWSGGLAPAVFLAWYHFTCFGSVAATANVEEPMMFQDQTLWLGMFGAPDLGIIAGLLVSPYRGLYIFAPVMLAALIAMMAAIGLRQRRAEMFTALAVLAVYLMMNASFQGWSKAWSGGWSFGPRYLIPAIPLLALPLCAAFDRLPKTTIGLAVLSLLVTLLGTAVDPQPPADIKSPIGQYLWPLAKGETVTLRNAPIIGPVSANPTGVYEPFYYRLFPAGSMQAQWNSFNLGEFLWEKSRMSLLPLAGVLLGSFWLLWRWSKVNRE